MPGQTPREAYDNYAQPLKQVLSCITAGHIINRGGYDTASKPSKFAFTHNPALLGDSGYALFFEQEFYIVPGVADPEEWKVSTSRYEYGIERTDTGQELFAFHWDQNQRGPVPYPHLHIGFGLKMAEPPVGPKTHVPSGRIAVEDLVFFLIGELGLAPMPARQRDWQSVVARARENFMRYKSW